MFNILPAAPPSQGAHPRFTQQDKEEKDWTHAYADDLKADIYTEVNADPKARFTARVAQNER